MNKKQKIIMWVGIAIFVFVSLNTETSFGRARATDLYTDYGPLIARLVSTAVVTLGLIVTFKDNKTRDEQKNQEN